MKTYKHKLLSGTFFETGTSNQPGSNRLGVGSRPFRASNFDISVELPKKLLGKDERGLVVSYPIILEKNALILKGGLDLQDLRFSMLFWDRLDLPHTRIIGGSHPDVDYLMKIGLITQTKVMIEGGGEMGAIYRASFVKSFQELEAREQGRWSISKGANSVSFYDTELEDGRGLIFELHNAIVVPTTDVPIADILEFKERRRPELLKLRYHLDGIYEAILDAPDRPLAEVTEFGNLEQALSDHLKVSLEQKFPLKLTGLTSKISVKDLMLGYATYEKTHSVLQALSVFAVSSFASIGIGAGLKNQKETRSPFEYVVNIHNDLFLGH